MSIIILLTFAVLVLCGLSTANTITFSNSGPVPLFIWTTQGVKGATAQDALFVDTYAIEVLSFTPGWSGMFKAIPFGYGPDDATSIGDVDFQGYENLTWFDDTDDTGVYFLFPPISHDPMSGCAVFPCPETFIEPNDRQSKSTTETDLTCFIGANQA